MTLISPRTLLAIAVIFALTTLAFGYSLPFAGDTPQQFLTDLLLFIGYIYLARTLVRLPIALVFDQPDKQRCDILCQNGVYHAKESTHHPVERN